MKESHNETSVIEQPLDFDLRENDSNFIYRLSKLNHFEEISFNIDFTEIEGVLNVLNGCFVYQDTITVGGGIFTKGKEIHGIRLVWQGGDTEIPNHGFFLQGQQIERFIKLMEKVSLKYDS